MSFMLMNFSSFYTQLNDIGKLVFIIVLLLFLILIILIIIMLFQKDDNKYKLIYEDDIIKDNDIDEENEKTRNLKNIVDELNKAKIDKTDLYEDEQEKTAIISYQELLKAAQEEKIEEPKKKPEIFSSVYGPNEVPQYKEKEKMVEERKENFDSETFLKSLKDFRSNL